MYDDDMLEAEAMELIDFDDELEMEDWAEYWRGDYDDEPLSYALDMGFDPYLGCYTEDC